MENLNFHHEINRPRNKFPSQEQSYMYIEEHSKSYRSERERREKVRENRLYSRKRQEEEVDEE